jgi:predicted branched-subunit amino acid permease
MPTRRAEFLAGFRSELPILAGVAPFGMIYGVLALAAGLPVAAAQAMSCIVFAGSAQFVAVQLIGGAAPWPVILLTTFVVNLRHMLYSASLAPYVKPLNRPWRWLLAYLLTDEAYAVTITRYLRPDYPPPPLAVQQRAAPSAADAPDALPDYRHWYYLAAGLTLWTGWQLSTAVGVFLGAQAPAGWSLDFTLPLTFIALVVPALKDRPAILAALSAGVVAVAAAALPFKLGLVLAALTGITVGLLAESSRGVFGLRVPEKEEA